MAKQPTIFDLASLVARHLELYLSGEAACPRSCNRINSLSKYSKKYIAEWDRQCLLKRSTKAIKLAKKGKDAP